MQLRGILGVFASPSMMMNRLDRRSALRHLAAGAGAALGSAAFPGFAESASATTGTASRPASGGPKRIIFFLQNQGFDPATCIPAGMKNSGSLAGVKLPEPIEALEPYKERLHILNGLHGLHTSPSHSAFSAPSAVIVAGTACRLPDRRSTTN